MSKNLETRLEENKKNILITDFDLNLYDLAFNIAKRYGSSMNHINKVAIERMYKKIVDNQNLECLLED